MTFNLFQIQCYKTRWWTAFLWFWVIAGMLFAIPVALVHGLWDLARGLKTRLA